MSKLSILAAALAVAACTEKSSKYCETHPDDVANCGAGTDGGVDPDGVTGCTDDNACAAPTPACDTASHTCVQCTAANTSACSGATPACVANACAPCTSHAECASNACMPDGSCADPNDVAYVQAGGSDAGDCTLTARCATVVKALSAAKPIVKIDGAIVESMAITLLNRDVKLLAETSPQASVTRSNQGPIVRVDGTSAVEIHGLQISGAGGVTTGFGIHAETGFEGTLVVDRAKLFENDGGGLYVNGTGLFTITNSVMAYNGTAQGSTKSLVGGVAITNNSMGSRFEFNTIAFNGSSNQPFVGGIACIASMVRAQGNLIHENFRPDGASIRADASSQRSGDCVYGASVATFGQEADPKFAKPDSFPLDFHLTAASPASVIDVVVGCSGTDVDGAPRPIGAGCDLGADEAR